MKSILIIIPAYNEEKNIKPCYLEIKKVITPLTYKYNFEILFVNDGSRDNTISEIEKLAQADIMVKYIDFSRNFGKELATTAGINSCVADACIMLDADMQHPVELIPEFIAKWEKGKDVVIGVRRDNKSDRLIKKLGSKLFYQTFSDYLDIRITRAEAEYNYQKLWKDQFALRIKIGSALQAMFGSERKTVYLLKTLRPFKFIRQKLLRLTHGKSY